MSQRNVNLLDPTRPTFRTSRLRGIRDALNSVVESLEARQMLATTGVFDYNSDRDNNKPQRVVLKFDGDVRPSLTMDDIAITNLTTGQPLNLPDTALSKSYLVSKTGGRTTATINLQDFSSTFSLLAAGNYELVVNGQGVQPVGGPLLGSDFVLRSDGFGILPTESDLFHYLPGDINHNRAVDFDDLLVLAQYYDSNVHGRTFLQGDISIDGVTGFDDMLILTQNYGAKLRPPPTTPSTLVVSRPQTDRIHLEWTPPGSGAAFDGFKVYRSTDGNTFSWVNTITRDPSTSPSTWSWDDRDIEDGKKYWYRVRAFTYAAGLSHTTNKEGIAAAMNAPSGLHYELIDDHSIRLIWTNNSSSATHYKVRQSSSNVPVDDVIADDITTTSYVVTGLDPGEDYFFSIQATNQHLESAPTGLLHVNTTGFTINGPGEVQRGQTATYTASLPVTASITWTVRRNDQVVANGHGSTFDFTPLVTGEYSVEAVFIRVSDSQPVVATLAITVVSGGEIAVTISGSTTVHRNQGTAVYTSMADHPQYTPDELIYNWSISPGTFPSGTITTLPSLSFIPTSAGDFSVTLTVTTPDSVLAESPITAADSARLVVIDEAAQSLIKLTDDWGENGFQDRVDSLVVTEAGKVLVAGTHGGWYGQDTRFAVGRYSVDPITGVFMRDDTFGDNGIQLIVHPDDPGPDDGWGAHDAVDDMVIQPDGKILLLGQVTLDDSNPNEVTDSVVVRLHPDGRIDTSFADNGFYKFPSPIYGEVARATALAIDQDGDIYVGGILFVGGGISAGFAAWHLSSSGTLDWTTYSPASGTIVDPYDHDFDTWRGAKRIRIVGEGADKRIIIGGDLPIVKPVQVWSDEDIALWKLDLDGNPDTGFGGGDGFVLADLGGPLINPQTSTTLPYNNDFIRDFFVDGSQIIAVGASAHTDSPFNGVGTGDSTRAALMYLDYATGDFDTSFSGDGIEILNPITLQGNQPTTADKTDASFTSVMQDDSGFVVSGFYGSSMVLQRFHRDGELDESFGGAGDGRISIAFENVLGVGMHSRSEALSKLDAGYVLAGTVGTVFGSSDVGLAMFRPESAGAANLVATARGNDLVGLKWLDTGFSEQGFGIERSSIGDAGPFELIASVIPGTTSYDDRSVSPNTRYFYRVFAFQASGANGRGGESNIANAKTGPRDSRYVSVETKLVPVDGSSVTTSTTLDVGKLYKITATGFFKLNQGAQRADAYYGRWNPTADEYSRWPTVLRYGLSIDDPTTGMQLTPHWGPPATDSAHTYTIFVEGNGEPLSLNYHDSYYVDNSIDDPQKALKIEIFRALPSMPSNVIAVADRMTKSVTIAWEDQADDEIDYRLERSIDGGTSFSELATLPAGSTSFVDTNIFFNTQYVYRVAARNTYGLSDWSNEASAVMINRAPIIRPVDARPIVGVPFEYQVYASDSENGTNLAWSIAPALPSTSLPGSLTISASGLINGWTPPALAPGATSGPDHFVNITVTDQDLTSTTRKVQLNAVNPNPDALTFATAPQVVQVGNRLDLAALAANDPLNQISYSWIPEFWPSGAAPRFDDNHSSSAKSTFAEISAAGTYVFRCIISKWVPGESGHLKELSGVGRTSISIARVLTTIEIRPESAMVSEGGAKLFSAFGADQFGHRMPITATFSVTGGDNEIIAADGKSATVSFGFVPGTYQVTASDGAVSDTVSVTVADSSLVNQAPVIVNPASARLASAPGSSAVVLGLSALAADWHSSGSQMINYEHLLEYHWSVVSAPSGSQPVVFGPTNGTNAGKSATVAIGSPTGTYVFRVTARDPSGLQVTSDTPAFDFSAAATATAVQISPQSADAVLNTSKSLVATMRDQFGRPLATQPTFQWRVNGGSVVATGAQFNYTPTTAGAKSITATDPVSGLVGVSLLMVDDEKPPVVSIKSLRPTNGVPAEVKSDQQVKIVVDDPNDNLHSWALKLFPAGVSAEGVVLASGTNEIGARPDTGAVATTIEPTRFADGRYTLVLEAKDTTTGAATVTDEFDITIRSDLKLGNFTLPVTDLSVPVSKGMPITISRIYDSNRAKRNAGDFGYGWRFEQADADLRSTLLTPTSALEAGDVYYFTLPGGKQYAFMFDPVGLGQPNSVGLYFTYSPRFRSIDGSSVTLTVPNDSSDHPFVLVRNTNGKFYDNSTADGYNPSLARFGNKFYLTTADKTVYTVAASTGRITRVEDVEHNYLIIDAHQIVSSSGEVVEINRGADGIESILDTAGREITFDYGVGTTANDELLGVQDRAGNWVRYSYEPPAGGSTERSHRMTVVKDANDKVLFQATYSPTGELQDLKDGYGNPAPMNHGGFDGDMARQAVKNLNGETTEMVYNKRGDVIREIRRGQTASGQNVFIITVRAYEYSKPNAVNSTTFEPIPNVLTSVTEFRPFEIAGEDLTGERFRRDPLAGTEVSIQNFDLVGTRLLASTVSYDKDHNQLVTTYESYKDGRPQKITDPQGNVNWQVYDDEGRLLYAINALGEGTKYQYDSAGRLEHTYRVYDQDRNPIASAPSVIGSATLTNVYYPQDTTGLTDALKGWLWKSTDQNGLTREYTYYSDGQTKEIWRSWVVSSVTHRIRDSYTQLDSAGRVYRVYDANGNYTQTNYDTLGRAYQSVDMYGGVTTTTFDGRGNSIRVQYPDGTETRTVYDIMGRVVWQSDRAATPTSGSNVVTIGTHTTFDAFGRAIGTQRHENVTFGLSSDALGPKTTVSTTGAAFISDTAMTFDAQGRVVASTGTDRKASRTEHYDNGQTKASINALNERTEYVSKRIYVPLLSAVGGDPARPDFLAGETTSNPKVLIREDSVTDAKGHVTRTRYDELGRVIVTFFHDDSFVETRYGIANHAVPGRSISGQSITGYMVTKFQQRLASETAIGTDYFYDESGRLTDIWLPATSVMADSSATITSDRQHWHYEYDTNGNQTAQVDPRGNRTEFGHDDQNRRISRKLPNITSQPTAEEFWTFDSYGRMLTHKDFEGQTTAYAYRNTYDTTNHYSAGQLLGEYRFAKAVTAIDGSGAILTNNALDKATYDYDYLGRRTHVREWSRSSTAVAFSTTENRLEVTSYDAITGGVKREDSPEGTIQRSFDRATGRLVSTWTGTGTAAAAATATSYSYDELGRIKTVTSTRRLGFTTADVTTYTYDSVGNLDLVASPNAMVEDYSYDDLNRLTSVEASITRFHAPTYTAAPDQPFKRLVFKQVYHLFSDGQRDYVEETRYQANSTAETEGPIDYYVKYDWDYDALDRLISEERTLKNSSDVLITNKGYKDEYTFDLAGNRRRKISDQYDTSIADTTTWYSYNSRDQLYSEQLDTNSDGSINSTTAYEYDLNGSTTLKDGSASDARYFYDLRNRMTGYSANGDTDILDANDIEYRYDSQGIRVYRNVVSGPIGGAETFLIDYSNPTGYSQVLQQANPGYLNQSFVLGLDVIGHQSSDWGTTYYYMYDGHGSVRGVMDAVQATGLAQIYDYDAFGNAIDLRTVGGVTTSIISSESVATPLLYSGEWTDNELGQQHLRSRFYSPQIGRFSSFDDFEASSASPSDLNKYVFVRSDPISRIDPSGNISYVTVAVSAGIGAMLSAIDAKLAGKGPQEIFYNAVIGGVMGAVTAPLASIKYVRAAVLGTGSALGFIGTREAYLDGNAALAAFRGATTSVGFLLSMRSVAQNLLPGGFGRSSQVLQSIGRKFRIFGTQDGLRDPMKMAAIKSAMMDGDYLYDVPGGRIGGYRSGGAYYIGEGHHRMTAAMEIAAETGNNVPLRQLLANGLWADVAKPPIIYPWGYGPKASPPTTLVTTGMIEEATDDK